MTLTSWHSNGRVEQLGHTPNPHGDVICSGLQFNSRTYLRLVHPLVLLCNNYHILGELTHVLNLQYSTMSLHS